MFSVSRQVAGASQTVQSCTTKQPRSCRVQHGVASAELLRHHSELQLSAFHTVLACGPPCNLVMSCTMPAADSLHLQCDVSSSAGRICIFSFRSC